MGDVREYSVVVPAYNEQARLRDPLVEAVRHFRKSGVTFEIIVVDDGSGDGTSRLVDVLMETHPEIRLIRLPTNRGKGFAVRTGIANSRGKYILFADADGSTPIGEVERLRARLEQGADVAIGSRALSDDDTQVHALFARRLMGRVFHGLVHVLTVGDFSDTQCGFKLLRGEVGRAVFARLRMDGFAFDVEFLSLALRWGLRVDEVPVNWSHKPGSKVHLLADSLRMIRDLFVIRSRLACQFYGPNVRETGEDDAISEARHSPGWLETG